MSRAVSLMMRRWLAKGAGFVAGVAGCGAIFAARCPVERTGRGLVLETPGALLGRARYERRTRADGSNRIGRSCHDARGQRPEGRVPKSAAPGSADVEADEKRFHICAEEASNLHPVIPDQALNLVT